ncbi:MAG: hypothetical protein WCK59_03650 [Candidatus Falkowbacteria bacterium]
MANLGLDSCLAATLIIENINHISGIEKNSGLSEEILQYKEMHYDEDLEDGYAGKNYYEEDDESDEEIQEDAPLVCFCDDDNLVQAVDKLSDISSILFFVGYEEKVIKEEIVCLLHNNQRIFFTSEFCAALSVSTRIKKDLAKDYYLNLRLSTARIFSEEYQDVKFNNEYLIPEKMRTVAENIINHYLTSWAIAYNIFIGDDNRLNQFHYEFLKQLIFEDKNQFINRLFELESEMEAETERQRKNIKYVGQGVYLLKAGSKRFFKTELLREGYERGFPFFAIQYVKNRQKKIISMDFQSQFYFEDGEFEFCENVALN